MPVLGTGCRWFKSTYADFNFGTLAQLVEQLLCKQQVMGSNPIGSINMAGLVCYNVVVSAVNPNSAMSYCQWLNKENTCR